MKTFVFLNLFKYTISITSYVGITFFISSKTYQYKQLQTYNTYETRQQNQQRQSTHRPDIAALLPQNMRQNYFEISRPNKFIREH